MAVATDKVQLEEKKRQKAVDEAAAAKTLGDVEAMINALEQDADLEQAVSAAMLANWYSCGEVCSNGTRIFVQESVREAFLRRFEERTRRLVVENRAEKAVGHQLAKTVSVASRHERSDQDNVYVESLESVSAQQPEIALCSRCRARAHAESGGAGVARALLSCRLALPHAGQHALLRVQHLLRTRPKRRIVTTDQSTF